MPASSSRNHGTDRGGDASSRHVPPAGAPLPRNLAALWALDAGLAARVEALHPREPYPAQPSKAGPPTVAAELPDGRRLFLHSRYDPAAEAERLVRGIDVAGPLVFHVFGFGLGYHVDALRARASAEAIVCVYEPDLLMLRTALECRDLTALLESRRVMFFTAPDKADLFTRLTPHTAMASLGTASLDHPPSRQLHPEFHRQLGAWAGEFASFGRTSMNTLVLNGRRTAENVARNLGWYVASPSVSRLRDRHKGKPAIVVSAGPSLRKNKHLLKDASERAVIVAVQTTLQPLLEMGVEPHFVTSLDYHEICTRFFEQLPPTLRTELVAEPKATSAIFSMYPGPVSILGNEYADGLIPEMKLDKERLPSGATVAHLAYYLAEHLGCDPIVFVGQDLGFSDGLCYAPGTSYEDVWRPELSRFCTVEMKQWEQIVRERFILRRIPDAEGRPMYTEERLFTYLQQFERDFATSKARIIDATEGGAAKRGATPMKLADVLATYCREPLARDVAPHPGMRWDRVPGCLASLRNRLDEAAEIERVSRETLPLLAEVRDHVGDQPRVNRAIVRIDALRARVNELGACYDLITQLTQTTELKRFEADRKISGTKLDPAEKQRRQVNRDIANVTGVVGAAAEFGALVRSVMDRVASESTNREAA
ncbi:MAG: Motility accessory factor [uncultured Phycisphaerae bacterium]|uniref:Motility accessory factor n=1 Tax=uncultured Phycisphaerae bacterium TaxID=904963 RepID=A0A6J4NMQ7_9BACT|nr:MAG: Motility accessory factor [uncultured Phycisphaerae bacterium]